MLITITREAAVISVLQDASPTPDSGKSLVDRCSNIVRGDQSNGRRTIGRDGEV